jgi:antitoxin VapB
MYTFGSYQLRRGHGRHGDRKTLHAWPEPSCQAAKGIPAADRVRVRHVGDGVLLEPIATDVDAWFAELDRFADVPFLEDGRDQPPMPGAADLFG